MIPRLPPLAHVVSGIVAVLFLDTFVGWGRYELHWSRYVGGACIVASIVLLLPAIRAFLIAHTTIDPRTPERSDVLVTSGIYRYSRNPMYLGMALLLAGEALILQHALALFVPMVFVALMTAQQIRAEECALQARFGQAYTDYRSRTRRWL